MKRKNLSLLMTVIVLMLSSCSINGGRVMNGQSESLDERFEQIVEAIKNQDKDSLRSLFSSQAISQAVDFENQIIELFRFIQGDIICTQKQSTKSKQR